MLTFIARTSWNIGYILLVASACYIFRQYILILCKPRFGTNIPSQSPAWNFVPFLHVRRNITFSN